MQTYAVGSFLSNLSVAHLRSYVEALVLRITQRTISTNVMRPTTYTAIDSQRNTVSPQSVMSLNASTPATERSVFHFYYSFPS